MEIYPAQCRAAPGLLGWTQEDSPARPVWRARPSATWNTVRWAIHRRCRGLALSLLNGRASNCSPRKSTNPG